MYEGDNSPWRGGKSSVWEGGSKTVSFIYSPLMENKQDYNDGYVRFEYEYPTNNSPKD